MHLDGRLRTIFAATLFFVALTIDPIVGYGADPLDTVLKSEGLIDLTRKTERLTRKTQWIEKDSNMFRLFRKNKPADLLVEWLTIDPKRGMPTVLKGYQEKEWVGFDGETPRGIGLRVRIPHPKIREAAELGMVNAFRDFHPLPVELSYTAQKEIQGYPATLRQYKTGLCQLTINIALGSVVEISQKECPDITVLSQTARGINIKRLSNKLKT